MKRWRNKLLLLGGAAVLGLAIPALGQEAPESLLPPGFGDPGAPLPPPAETTPAPRPSAPAPAPVSAPPPPGLTEEDAEALDEAELPKPIEIPDASRRPRRDGT